MARVWLKALRAVGDAIAGAGGPWLALALRLTLGTVFLTFQLHTMMLGDKRTIVGWSGDFIRSVVHSDMGTVVQTVCPLLLALGLLSRPAALAMLLAAVLTPVSASGATLWAVLLGWLAVSGPGAISVDRLLLPSARASAVPFAPAVARAYAWSSRVLAPGYLCAVRVALALALAGAWGDALTPYYGGAIMTAMGSITHAGPGAPVLTIFLAVGLLVRPVALVLAASGLLGMAEMGGGDATAWLLLAAVLLVHGAGWPSVDGWLRRWAATRAAPPAAGVPHVVVVGGGFGGISAVQALRATACRITLVDRRNHHLFQPLLYQVATAGLSPADIATPIREMLRDQANVRVLLGDVSAIDPVGKTIRVAAATLPYDMLVLATGARHSYLGHDDWSGWAPGLKSLEDAIGIRRRLLLAFEEAESTDDPAERQAWLTFLIVGGGPTGVELAGAIAELARNGLTGEFRTIDPGDARVVLVQSGARLLPAFPAGLSADAERSLRHLGVEVVLGARVEAVCATGVTVGGAAIATRTVLWAAGVLASPAAGWLGTKADKAGRVVVAPDLSVPGLADVFAIGDTAASNGWDGEPVPGLAPAAKQAGHYVARVIAARVGRRPPPPPFRYRHFGSLATIGRQAAVADFGRVRLRGALAWWVWGAAHIAFLVGGRNRLLVTTEWLWAYLTFRRGTRLITGPGPSQAGSGQGLEQLAIGATAPRG